MKLYNKLDHPEILGFIFHPRQEERHSQTEKFSDFDVEIENDTVLGCRLFIHGDKSPTILYFHGNGETVSDYDIIAPLYNEVGLNFIIATYRGYGWSSGTPTVENMINDCIPILESSQRVCKKYNLT